MGSVTVGSTLFQHTAATTNKINKKAPPSMFKVETGKLSSLNSTEETKEETPQMRANAFVGTGQGSQEEKKNTPYTTHPKAFGLNTAKRNAGFGVG